MQPKLGMVTSHWVRQDGQPVLVLQHALRLAPSAIALPHALAMLPLLCDGTRDVGALRASLIVRSGVRIREDVLAHIIQQMDEALLFDNEREREAHARALDAYRQAESRLPVSANASYPDDEQAATRCLDEYMAQAGIAEGPSERPGPPATMRAIVTPHIDYPRGWRTYARTWGPAREAVRRADLVVVLGTDHHGPPGSITLTRQHYQTPWGNLQTDAQAVDHLAAAIGTDAAYACELHHGIEHSVELAAVWLRYMAGDHSITLLPVICGSFAPFVSGDAAVEEHLGINRAIAAMRDLAAGAQRVLLAAAVDFAHMGPAFGGSPVSSGGRAACREADGELLRAICAGDAEAFLAQIQAEGDRRNVCGTPPLYVMLRVLDGAQGVAAGYDQCPADEEGASIVSIAGAWLW
jgi:MEMO1 family protein